MVKTQRKHISSRFLKNTLNNWADTLVCKQNMICYVDFHSCLKANYPKSLPSTLKGTFALEIHCKKHLPTPKQLLINQINTNTTKARHSSVLPGNTKCSVTSHTRWRPGGHHDDIYKYRSIDGPADFAGR